MYTNLAPNHLPGVLNDLLTEFLVWDCPLPHTLHSWLQTVDWVEPIVKWKNSLRALETIDPCCVCYCRVGACFSLYFPGRTSVYIGKWPHLPQRVSLVECWDHWERCFPILCICLLCLERWIQDVITLNGVRVIYPEPSHGELLPF